MSNQNTSTSGGIGFIGLLTIVFIVLKLTKIKVTIYQLGQGGKKKKATTISGFKREILFLIFMQIRRCLFSSAL